MSDGVLTYQIVTAQRHVGVDFLSGIGVVQQSATEKDGDNDGAQKDTFELPSLGGERTGPNGDDLQHTKGDIEQRSNVSGKAKATDQGGTE